MVNKIDEFVEKHKDQQVQKYFTICGGDGTIAPVTTDALMDFQGKLHRHLIILPRKDYSHEGLLVVRTYILGLNWFMRFIPADRITKGPPNVYRANKALSEVCEGLQRWSARHMHVFEPPEAELGSFHDTKDKIGTS